MWERNLLSRERVTNSRSIPSWPTRTRRTTAFRAGAAGEVQTLSAAQLPSPVLGRFRDDQCLQLLRADGGVQYRLEQTLLRTEVVVDQSGVDPGFLSDGASADRLEGPGREQSRGSLLDA